MRFLRALALLAVLSVLSFASTLIGQDLTGPGSTGQAATAPRIVGPINERSLVTLRGNVPSRARAEFDSGEAAPSTLLSHVRLVFSRNSQQQAALDQYDAELQEKSSPNYHKWLTPEEFGRLYGPADSDIAAIVSWLESHGLQVDPVAPGRTDISFSGSVRQVEALLHTSIHSYEVNGEQFLANRTNPSIPAALSAVVSGVARLNTIRPRPQHVRSTMGTFDPSLRRMTPVPGSSQGPRAQLTTGAGTSANPYTLYLVAGDAATIYDTPNSSLNANFAGGTTYDGTGVTIGIGGDAVIQASTVVDYRTKFLNDSSTNKVIISYCTGISETPPSSCSINGSSAGIGSGDADEAYLDTELSGALAPGATIHYYASADLYGAVEGAINENTVGIFSLSFGLCELGLATADNQLINGWWQQAATQGIAVTVSTGDSGSAACDSPSSQTTAMNGLMVSGFASTPYNIAVGGTDFAGLATSFTTYAATSNSSSTFYRTALKYIPESTWNDSTTVNTTISANVPFTDSQGNTNIVAGSGGASNCSTNQDTSTTIGACNHGYPKPAWQRGTGVPSDGVRDLPDVSLMAGAGGDNAAWLVCTDDSGPNSSNVTVTANCTQQSDGHFYFFGFGGTSTSAPAFAGILALVQQKKGGKLGQAAQDLYDLSVGSHSSAVFHDITTGNNAVPCTAGSPDCQANGFLSGYDTTAGYDLATGIGSVDATQLINYWSSARGAGTATVNINALASSSITTASGVTLTGTVSGTAGTPTGSVTLVSDGSVSTTSQNLAAGAFTIAVAAGTLQVGSDTLTVNYSGDASYEPASAHTTITVNGANSTVSINPSSTSLKASDTLTVTGTVSGSGGTPTGNVALFGFLYGQVGQLDSGGNYTIKVPANSFYANPSQGTLTVSYGGDKFFAQSSGVSGQITVTPVYSLSATSPAAISAGGSTSSTITVSSLSGYAGTATLTCSVSGSPTGATNLPACTPAGTVSLSSTTASATTTVNITTTKATALLERPRVRGGWAGAGGGAVLAFLIFLGIPSRRRKWISMLGTLLVTITVASLAACGGSGGSGGGGGGSTGTTSGTYTFAVSGTGNDSAKITATTTFTLTVQ